MVATPLRSNWILRRTRSISYSNFGIGYRIIYKTYQDRDESIVIYKTIIYNDDTREIIDRVVHVRMNDPRILPSQVL